MILPSPTATPSYDAPLELIISSFSPLFFTSYPQTHLQLIRICQKSSVPCEQHVPEPPDRLRRHVQFLLTDCSEGFRVSTSLILRRWSSNSSQFPTHSREHEDPNEYGSYQVGQAQDPPLRVSPFLALPTVKSSMCQRKSKPK